MAQWEKLPPYTGVVHQGCLNCSPVTNKARLDTVVAVGFGFAAVTKDEKVVYQEDSRQRRLARLRRFEKMARLDPDHDWRLVLHAPLRSRTYQRQGHNQWVLVESGQGFA